MGSKPPPAHLRHRNPQTLRPRSRPSSLRTRIRKRDSDLRGAKSRFSKAGCERSWINSSSKNVIELNCQGQALSLTHLPSTERPLRNDGLGGIAIPTNLDARFVHCQTSVTSFDLDLITSVRNILDYPENQFDFLRCAGQVSARSTEVSAEFLLRSRPELILNFCFHRRLS